MKLSFLIQLLLLVILIVGVYLVATNSVSGRTKLIAIIFLVVIGIYLFYNLPFFQNYNEIVSDPQSARFEYDISASQLKPTDGQFTLSMWIYIEDWNYKYGQEKVILKKEILNGSGQSIPKISLDAYKNDLSIKLDVIDESRDEFQASMFAQLDDLGSTAPAIADLRQQDLECSGGEIYNTAVAFNADGGSETPGYVTESSNRISCNNTNTEDVKIENIPLQKWNQIAVSVNTRTMDVYLNGKLVRSRAFNNVIDTALFNNGGISVTPNGGFDGFVSKVQYYNYFISPQEAWNIYRGGFGDVFASALNKYNMSVTFYEDAVEKKKYWVF